MTKSWISAASLAGRIEKTLAGDGLASVPSISELARQFHASRATVSKAVKILAGRGKNGLDKQADDSQPGQGSYQQVSGALRKGRYSAQRLFKILENGITTGTYQSGAILPKISYYTASFHVSNHTVRSALEMLLEQGLAYRKGKHIVVGRLMATHSSAAGLSQRSIIFVVAEKLTTWEAFCVDKRAGMFGETFNNEALRFGVELVHALYHRPVEESEPWQRRFCIGIEDAAKMISGERTVCLGAILLGRPAIAIDLKEWISLFVTRRIPVVWLDVNDKAPDLYSGGPPFYRCCFSEMNAVQTALDYLQSMGHRKVAYLFPYTIFPWQTRRLALLEEQARIRNFPMTVLHEQVPVPTDWASERAVKFKTVMADLHDRGPAIVREALDYFAEKSSVYTERFAHEAVSKIWDGSPYAGLAALAFAAAVPGGAELQSLEMKHVASIDAGIVLAPCLLEGATAIISPDDISAVSYHVRWLERTGYVVPGPLSIISFDNHYRYSPRSITTIDMGFGYLGYQAFHAILRDIPVKHDRRGNIAAHCTVIDRKTVQNVIP